MMKPQELIARRVAQELRDGMLVNLGIGMPTMVANFLPPNLTVFLQSENGLIGLDQRPPEGMEDSDLTDAGGGFVTAIPGAVRIDSNQSFGLIRGGHLDMTVLGGLQVDSQGLLANWMIPGKMVPGMGGAMDLVTGAKKVVVAMIHTAKGNHKIIPKCEWPLTSARPVDMIVTEMAVIHVTPKGLVLSETAPGVTVEEVIAATGATLIVAPDVKPMNIDITA
jgi:acetate CoA/acetoacetate CoA-transferase beta subunit